MDLIRWCHHANWYVLGQTNSAAGFGRQKLGHQQVYMPSPGTGFGRIEHFEQIKAIHFI